MLCLSNIIYYVFLLALYGNAFYLCGYLSKRNTSLRFEVDINGNDIRIRRGYQTRHTDPEPNPRQLDAFRMYTIEIDGRRFFRRSAEIGGEPHFSLNQISQIFGLEFRIVDEQD